MLFVVIIIPNKQQNGRQTSFNMKLTSLKYFNFAVNKKDIFEENANSK